MLLDILQTFCIHTGYDPVQQRNSALNYINRYAKDLYNTLESDAMMRELVLIVPAGQQVTLPPYIGELRGMREYNWSTTINLNQIGVPRFSSDTQKFRWRNWTYKGKIPLANNITNASQLVLTTSAVETNPAIVSIVGRTANSHKITETITIVNTTMNTANSFQSIDAIIGAKQIVNGVAVQRTVDIVISDIDGNELAKLYNNESKTEYILVDVSTYSWIAQVGDGMTTLIEVLYKDKFYKFFNDTDEFNAPGYDDAIAFGATALWYVGQDGKEANAAAMGAAAKSMVDANVTNDERGQVLKIQHKKNPVYDVFFKFRTCFNWKRTLWSDRH